MNQNFALEYGNQVARPMEDSKNFPTYPWNIPQSPNQGFGDSWGYAKQGYVGVLLERSPQADREDSGAEDGPKKPVRSYSRTRVSMEVSN